MTPRRYQLKKEPAGVVMGHHPWIFRDTLSSAAAVFADGDWLRLVDGHNKVLGFGMYEAEGAIAIRLLRCGCVAPCAASTPPAQRRIPGSVDFVNASTAWTRSEPVSKAAPLIARRSLRSVAAALAKREQLAKTTAVFETNKGTITVGFTPDKAPEHVPTSCAWRHSVRTTARRSTGSSRAS